MSSTPCNTDELYVGQRKTPKIMQPSTTMSRKFVYVQNIALAFLKDGGLHCEAYGVPLTPQRVYSCFALGHNMHLPTCICYGSRKWGSYFKGQVLQDRSKTDEERAESTRGMAG